MPRRDVKNVRAARKARSAELTFDHSNSVDAPSHYASDKDDPYEAVKVMLAWHGVEATRWFCHLSAEKYLARAGKKVHAGSETKEGATVLDLRKASIYCTFAANLLEHGEVRK